MSKSRILASVICFMLCCLSSLQADEVICPTTDWIASAESSTCLKFHTEGSTYTWDGARTICQDDGGDLVKIISRKMNNFIQDSSKLYPDFLALQKQRMWIGLNDFDDDGNWVWLNETEPASWTNWLEGEPSDGLLQYCATIAFEEDAQWMDDMCDGESYWDTYFICENPPVTTTTAGPVLSTVHTTLIRTAATAADHQEETTVAPALTDNTAEGLGTGTIAGIAVAACVVLVAIVFVSIKVYQRSQTKKKLNGVSDSVAFVNESSKDYVKMKV